MGFLTWVVVGSGLFLLTRRNSTPASSPESKIASFYGGSYHGRLTANGETFDQFAMTAAHRTLPFNTKVRVTDIDNGKSVVVRINDRGPFVKTVDGVFTREIDLSLGAAAAIGLDIKKGLARVTVEVL